jgi:hypothetical protein
LSSIIMIMTVVAIGLAIGVLRGGRLEALFSVRPRWWGLLVAGFVLHAISETFDVPGALSLAVIGIFGMIVSLLANGAAIRGAIITAFGLSLNLAPLVTNGAVPVRLAALVEAGAVDPGTTRSQVTSVGHMLELESTDSNLGSLGDVIPIGLLSSVISIGDLVTFAGVIVMIAGIIATPRRLGLGVDELFAPALPTVDLDEVLDLDTAPIADESLVVLPAESAIDLTATLYDPDDLWADEPDEGVHILGPSTRSR